MSDSLLSSTPLSKGKHSRQSKATQESIEGSLENLRYQALLLNNVRDAVVVWDTNGKITYMNPAAQLLFSWGMEDWLDMPVDAYLNSFIPPGLIPHGEGTAGLKRERQFNPRHGAPIWVSSHVYALRDHSSGGKLIGFMDVCRNITDNKEMEARVQAVQTQLIHAARLAAIGELASGVAHHINNPLTTIIAEAQILLHSLPEDHPAYDSAQAIETAGWRMQRAVQRLLDFSRPATDMLESLDLNETIFTALELLGDQISQGEEQINLQLSEALPRVNGNRHHLVELWLNLLMLAHWSGIDGRTHRIHIRSCAPSSQFIQVEISDNGEPVQPGEANTLYEADLSQKGRVRGTGVELALCQEIVRQHRGEITAENAANGDTILRVTLPAA